MFVTPGRQLFPEFLAQACSDQAGRQLRPLLVYEEREVVRRSIVEIHNGLDFNLLERVRPGDGM